MTTLELKKPSYELQLLIEDASKSLVSFAEKWSQVKQIGNNEGFTDKQLQDMIRPYLKHLGQTKDQIYYLFNAEKEKERAKETYRNLPKVNHKDVMEEYPSVSVQPDDKPIGEKLNEAVDVVEENRALRTTVQQLREVIAKKAVESGDTVETNFERLFEMLPNDDVDTFKNKTGTLMLMERVLVNFRYQDPAKRLKYQLWIRRIK